MNLKTGNFILWLGGATTLLLIKQCHFVNGDECVLRLAGACKVMPFDSIGVSTIKLKDFHSPQPEGFLLKTSIEIIAMEDLHNFEKKLTKETTTRIAYVFKPAKVRVDVWMETSMGRVTLSITLGLKSGRMAAFEYYKLYDGGRKYCTYTPILPRFPYRLHMEITTNGTFSVNGEGNVEPFFTYQIDGIKNVTEIHIVPLDRLSGETELVALVDCNLEGKPPSCGTYRVDRLYGCRESIREDHGLFGLSNTTYSDDVLVNEIFVVDTKDNSELQFEYRVGDGWQKEVRIEFHVDYITGILYENYSKLKAVQTKQWTEVPASPYSVRVVITGGTDDSHLRISNIHGHLILQLNLCEKIQTLDYLRFYNRQLRSTLYFDCIDPSNYESLMGKRPEGKYDQDRYNFVHDQIGYNFTKVLLDTQQFVDENRPVVLYTHAFGNSTQDWCEGDPQPELYVQESDKVKKKDGNEINQSILLELQRIRASIDALASDAKKNVETVHNNLNVEAVDNNLNVEAVDNDMYDDPYSILNDYLAVYMT